MVESATDDLLRLLAHRRRRQVLDALVSHPTPAISLGEHLEWGDPDSAARAEWERHLDILDRAGVVDYDDSRGIVERGRDFDRIAPLVRAVSDTAERRDVANQRDQLELVNRGLCHDLRNSLNVLQGRVTLLAEDGADDTEYDHHAVVEERIQEMMRRVETGATFTNMVVSDAANERRDLPVRDVLVEEVDQVDRLYEHADVGCVGVPDVTVRADDRLSLVFDNLLRNAVEHSDRESPTVRAYGDCDCDQVTVAVVDYGPGIPEETRAALSGDVSTTAPEDPLGIGLQFVARTVADYAGDLAVENRDPRGAAVRVRLRRGSTGEVSQSAHQPS